MDLSKTQNIAQERWAILRNALLRKPVDEVPPCSIRNHNLLNAFEILSDPSRNVLYGGEWQVYKLRNVELREDLVSAIIRRPDNDFSFEDFLSPDNTGNICIWASEQAMARYLMKKISQFNHTSAIELGGGYSCLSGVLLAKYCSLEKMILSDGNEKAVENVQQIAHRNNLKSTDVIKFRWNDESLLAKYAGMFDCVLAADCIFRDDQRRSLVSAINVLLKCPGFAIIFSPKRGTALDDFISKVRVEFGCDNVEIIEKYDDELWNDHLSNLNCSTYRTDVHYPICVRIRKQ